MGYVRQNFIEISQMGKNSGNPDLMCKIATVISQRFEEPSRLTYLK